MSATLKTLTGAALAAAITLGGISSAYAQNEEQPFYDGNVIEEVQTDAWQPMFTGSDDSGWYSGISLVDQHYNWIGAREGCIQFDKLFSWQGVDHLYHKGGKIISNGTNTYFYNLWVTTDTLFATRSDSMSSTPVVENFHLQVGTTDVYGESFGNPTADTPLVLNEKSITYDGKTTSSWGVDTKKDTRFFVENYGGVIHDVTVNGGVLNNDCNGTIHRAYLAGGNIDNQGTINYLTMVGGKFANWGTIDEAAVENGYIQSSGHIGTIAISNPNISTAASIYGTADNVTVSDAKVEFAGSAKIESVVISGYGSSVANDSDSVIEEATLNDGFLWNAGYIKVLYMNGGYLDNDDNNVFDCTNYIETLYYSGGAISGGSERNIGEIIYVDNANVEADADGQDAAPLGEEVMVW